MGHQSGAFVCLVVAHFYLGHEYDKEKKEQKAKGTWSFCVAPYAGSFFIYLSTFFHFETSSGGPTAQKVSAPPPDFI